MYAHGKSDPNPRHFPPPIAPGRTSLHPPDTPHPRNHPTMDLKVISKLDRSNYGPWLLALRSAAYTNDAVAHIETTTSSTPQNPSKKAVHRKTNSMARSILEPIITRHSEPDPHETDEEEDEPYAEVGTFIPNSVAHPTHTSRPLPHMQGLPQPKNIHHRH